MKNFDVALCDSDEAYITAFADYLTRKKSDLNLHVFTNPESFFADEKDYDLGIMTEEFQEISTFVERIRVKTKYLLTEDVNLVNEEKSIFKFQSMDKILDQIKEIKIERNLSTGIFKLKEGPKIYTVISPSSHELQLPFSLALSNSLKGKTLFLDLEAISILPNLAGIDKTKNLMDLLFEISTGAENLSLSDYIHSWRNVDYLIPFYNPTEINSIEEENWKLLYEKLLGLPYQNIVILFGTAVTGYEKILPKAEKMYLLTRPGQYYRRFLDSFYDFLSRAKIEVNTREIEMQVNESKLAADSYSLDEMIDGNLTSVVRKALKEENTMEADLYEVC